MDELLSIGVAPPDVIRVNRRLNFEHTLATWLERSIKF